MSIVLSELVFRNPEHPSIRTNKLNDLVTYVEAATAVTTNANVAALAGLTGAADKVPYFTGAGAMALADFPAFGRTLVANASAADARTDLAISATNTPFTPVGGLAATDVQTALAELDTEKLAAASYTAADVLAKLVTVDGTGSSLDADFLDAQSGAYYLARANHTGSQLAATISDFSTAADARIAAAVGVSVQAQDAQLAAIAGLTPAADQVIYWTGPTAAAMTGFTSVARTLAAQTTQALMRTTGLGLGTAATQNTGTSGANLPFLNGINTWSDVQTISANNVPVTINSTNSNTYKFNFQRAGATDCYVGSNGTYIWTVADSGVVDRVGFGVAASPGLYLNTTRVVTTRKTGWATATGTATRTTFATGSVTLPQLAERVKALIDDLHGTAGHGLIGT